MLRASRLPSLQCPTTTLRTLATRFRLAPASFFPISIQRPSSDVSTQRAVPIDGPPRVLVPRLKPIHRTRFLPYAKMVGRLKQRNRRLSAPITDIKPGGSPRNEALSSSSSHPRSRETFSFSNTEQKISQKERHLICLAETQSAVKAWRAYCALLEQIPDGTNTSPPHIPLSHLHRLIRILAGERPKSHRLHLRLLSVVKMLRRSGGSIHLDEWNALIASAGGAWRKTRPEDFRSALSIFEDMISNKDPGDTSQGLVNKKPHETVNVKPDIVTYTTLLTIATRTNRPRLIGQVTSLLQESGLPPNRYTHLTLIKYFTLTNDLRRLRMTLEKMKHQRLELGIEGLNAHLWFFGRTRRVELAWKIYQVLLHNAVPDRAKPNADDIETTKEYLADVQGITISSTIVPDHITYTSMVQIMAYHGHFHEALRTYIDMLSSKKIDVKSPSTAPFRAFFLGFVRHGVSPNTDQARPYPSQPGGWTLENLEVIFQVFLTATGDIKAYRCILYWIMIAFKKTSGDNLTKLREVWVKLEAKFPGRWAGPGHRLTVMKAQLFPSEEIYYAFRLLSGKTSNDLASDSDTK